MHTKRWLCFITVFLPYIFNINLLYALQLQLCQNGGFSLGWIFQKHRSAAVQKLSQHYDNHVCEGWCAH